MGVYTREGPLHGMIWYGLALESRGREGARGNRKRKDMKASVVAFSISKKNGSAAANSAVG